MENEKKPSFGKTFLDALYVKNPVFSLFLGLTIALLATNRLQTAFIVGLIVFVDLLLTESIVSLLRNHLGKAGAYLLSSALSAGFATLGGILVSNTMGYLIDAKTASDSLVEILTVLVPFAATSSLVLAKSEDALTRPFALTLADSLGSGLGYLLALLVLALFREFLATGGVTFIGPDRLSYGPMLKNFPKISLLAKPFGGFLFAGLFSGIHGSIVLGIRKHQEKRLSAQEGK